MNDTKTLAATPLTDAVWRAMPLSTVACPSETLSNMGDLCARLERDLAAARADNARLRDALRGMVNAFAPKAELTVSISGADALQSDVKRALQALGCLMPDAQARATLAQVQS